MLEVVRHFRPKSRSNDLYAVIDPYLWISGVLYGVFVSGLRGLVRLPVHPQWSRSLQYVHASICRSHAFVRRFLLSKSF